MVAERPKDSSCFSRISVDLVVAISSFLDPVAIARLSRCCALLRSRVSLSLAGSVSPALASLRHMKFTMTTRVGLENLAPLLARVQKLVTLEIWANKEAARTSHAADMNAISKTLVSTAFPPSLTRLRIASDLLLDQLLQPLACCPSVESLWLRFGLAGENVTTMAKLPELPKLRCLNLAPLRPADVRFVYSPAQVGVLKLIAASPALQILRLEYVRVSCEAVFKALETIKPNLTGLTLKNVGEAEGWNPVYQQIPLKPIQDMTSLQTLRVAYGELGANQRLSEFPSSLTGLECSTNVFTADDSAGVVLPKLKKLALSCHGQAPGQFVGAARAVSKWCPQLEFLSFACPCNDAWCNGVHQDFEFLDVLSLIADDAFPVLNEFSISYAQSGDTAERKLSKLLKTIKAKRPSFTFLSHGIRPFEGGGCIRM